MSGWAIAGFVLMAVIYGGIFPVLWIVDDRETKRLLREMEWSHARNPKP